MSDGREPARHRDERLIRLTVAIVVGDWDELGALRRAAPPEAVDRAFREAVLQTHLFAGFPRVVAALEVLDAAGGIGSPTPEELEDARVPLDLAPGAELFERIYADRAEAVRGRIAELHPDFERWIAEHAYARVLARPGLSAALRERLACAALIATRQDRQLASHARGAIRCGATPDELLAILPALAGQVPEDALERGRQILERFGRHPEWD